MIWLEKSNFIQSLPENKRNMFQFPPEAYIKTRIILTNQITGCSLWVQMENPSQRIGKQNLVIYEWDYTH